MTTWSIDTVPDTAKQRIEVGERSVHDQFVDIGGLKIRYRDSGGPGRPVLFIHGIAASLEVWHSQLSQFDPSIRTIVVDLPGHGLSDMPLDTQDVDTFASFLWQFADAVQIGKVTLVGNSLGGAIGLRMAGLLPARVAGLLMADSATLGQEVFLPFRLMTLPVLGEMMNRPGPGVVEKQLQAIFHDPAVVTPYIREYVTRNIHRPGAAAVFLATLRRMTGLRGQDANYVAKSHNLLKALRLPCVILHGRQDTVLPLQHAQKAAELAPSASLVILDRCGHTPQIEKPSLFNQLVLNLVARGEGVAE